MSEPTTAEEDAPMDAPTLTGERPVRGRYAPSPTGPLHLGNLRTALLSWLQVRLQGGTYVMRMEDLDQPRCVEGSAEQILDDLRWLGLDWDEGPDVGGPHAPYDQSARDHLYREALERLLERDLVFRCFCSRRDVREAASAPHGPHGRVIYPGTCRELGPEEADAAWERRDGMHSIRMRAPARTIRFDDEVAGRFEQNLATELGDFVIRRADELFAYQLAVVVDDGLMEMTDVLRGDDLLDSTPRQILLYEELGFEVPRFWHVPLMRDDSGERMSKRERSTSLDVLRERGDRPEEVVGRLAASVGLVEPGAELTPAELVDELTLDAFRDALRDAHRQDTAETRSSTSSSESG